VEIITKARKKTSNKGKKTRAKKRKWESKKQ